MTPNEIACQIALRDKRSLRRQKPNWRETNWEADTWTRCGELLLVLALAVVIIREALR